MKSKHLDISAKIKNLARGNRQYAANRAQIGQIIRKNSGRGIIEVGSHLRSKLMRLEPKSWMSLDFEPADWANLRELRSGTSGSVEDNYIALTVAYIVENAQRVQRLYDESSTISAHLLDSTPPADGSLMRDFDQADRMSLFAARLFIASNAHSSDALADHFRTALPSHWAKNRLVYPLLNYSLNNIQDSKVDFFLNYVVNSSYDAVEKLSVRILLNDWSDAETDFAFKAYLGLMLHPFDACEIFINQIEIIFTRDGVVSKKFSDALAEIAQVISCDRLKDAQSTLRRAPIKLFSQLPWEHLRRRFKISEATAKSVVALVQIEPIKTTIEQPALAELTRMRKAKFPNPVDFDVALSSFLRWRFTEAGRLLQSISEALYLQVRADGTHERRSALRLCLYFGGFNAVILAGPSARDLVTDRFLVLDSVDSDTVEALCASALGMPNEREDRIWISALHWKLYEHQRSLNIRSWLSVFRKFAPVAPGYLTGVNWNWFDEHIRSRRLKVFQGDANAGYALLLRQIEERPTDSWLRLVVEPYAENSDLEIFVGRLIDEYGPSALAFIKYFLSPENILRLKLAPNYTAALAGRVSALRYTVRKFGFTDYLSEKQYEDDSRTLTSALLLKGLMGSQFDIAWDIFKRDVAEEERYLLETIHSLFNTTSEQGLLGRASVKSTHTYPNGRTIEYSFENRHWPFASAMLQIIDSFMEHPSVGIEVLLSTRFRHDTLRREYEKRFEAMSDLHIVGIFNDHKAEMIQAFSAAILDGVDNWARQRIQSRRPGRESGLFDFAPSQDEADALISMLVQTDSPQQIIDETCNWLSACVEQQAVAAGAIFDKEIRDRIGAAINIVKEKLASEETYRMEQVTKVAEAVSTVSMQTTNDLVPWFSAPAEKDRPSMTIFDVKLAADGLYESYILNNSFSTKGTNREGMDIEITADRARLLFDLFDEVYANAIKYGSSPASVRVNFRKIAGSKYLVASSTAPKGVPVDWDVTGERYKSTSDTIFGEGSSGLGKVAALTATLAGEKATIYAFRRKYSFHLLLPLTLGDEDGSRHG